MNDLDKFIIARWCYAIGVDWIPDVEYDELYRKLKDDPNAKEYYNRSWSSDPCPVGLLRHHGLEDLIQNIVTIGTGESIPSLISKEDVEATYPMELEDCTMSYKLDGWNVTVTYYNGKPVNARTRGRASDAKNANAILQIVPKEIPYFGTVNVTGEAIISKSDWEDVQSITGNKSQRSSVSTLLANNMSQYLTFVTFNISGEQIPHNKSKFVLLRELGFKVPQYFKVATRSQIFSMSSYMSLLDATYPYPTDGIVIDTPSSQYALRIDGWQEKPILATVKGYKETVGLYSNSIQLEVEPITVNGVTYTTISCVNLGTIIENNIKIGSQVRFSVRSSANPVLLTS